MSSSIAARCLNLAELGECMLHHNILENGDNIVDAIRHQVDQGPLLQQVVVSCKDGQVIEPDGVEAKAILLSDLALHAFSKAIAGARLVPIAFVRQFAAAREMEAPSSSRDFLNKLETAGGNGAFEDHDEIFKAFEVLTQLKTEALSGGEGNDDHAEDDQVVVEPEAGPVAGQQGGAGGLQEVDEDVVMDGSEVHQPVVEGELGAVAPAVGGEQVVQEGQVGGSVAQVAQDAVEEDVAEPVLAGEAPAVVLEEVVQPEVDAPELEEALEADSAVDEVEPEVAEVEPEVAEVVGAAVVEPEAAGDLGEGADPVLSQEELDEIQNHQDELDTLAAQAEAAEAELVAQAEAAAEEQKKLRRAAREAQLAKAKAKADSTAAALKKQKDDADAKAKADAEKARIAKVAAEKALADAEAKKKVDAKAAQDAKVAAKAAEKAKLAATAAADQKAKAEAKADEARKLKDAQAKAGQVLKPGTVFKNKASTVVSRKGFPPLTNVHVKLGGDVGDAEAPEKNGVDSVVVLSDEDGEKDKKQPNGGLEDLLRKVLSERSGERAVVHENITKEEILGLLDKSPDQRVFDHLMFAEKDRHYLRALTEVEDDAEIDEALLKNVEGFYGHAAAEGLSALTTQKQRIVMFCNAYFTPESTPPKLSQFIFPRLYLPAAKAGLERVLTFWVDNVGNQELQFVSFDDLSPTYRTVFHAIDGALKKCFSQAIAAGSRLKDSDTMAIKIPEELSTGARIDNRYIIVFCITRFGYLGSPQVNESVLTALMEMLLHQEELFKNVDKRELVSRLLPLLTKDRKAQTGLLTPVKGHDGLTRMYMQLVHILNGLIASIPPPLKKAKVVPQQKTTEGKGATQQNAGSQARETNGQKGFQNQKGSKKGDQKGKGKSGQNSKGAAPYLEAGLLLRWRKVLMSGEAPKGVRCPCARIASCIQKRQQIGVTARCELVHFNDAEWKDAKELA